MRGLKRVGLITIGQSPREDIVGSVKQIMGQEYEIIEAGALDDIENPLGSIYRYNGGPRKGEIYVSRLRDGSQIEMDEYEILPLIENCINKLSCAGAGTTGILCTGEYRALEKYRRLVRPYVVLHAFIDALFPSGSIGIIVPTEHQIDLKLREWKRESREVHVRWASPYQSIDKISGVSKELAGKGVDCIILDCLGFNEEIKNYLKRDINIPIILPNSLLAWTLRELV